MERMKLHEDNVALTLEGFLNNLVNCQVYIGVGSSLEDTFDAIVKEVSKSLVLLELNNGRSVCLPLDKITSVNVKNTDI